MFLYVLVEDIKNRLKLFNNSDVIKSSMGVGRTTETFWYQLKEEAHTYPLVLKSYESEAW